MHEVTNINLFLSSKSELLQYKIYFIHEVGPVSNIDRYKYHKNNYMYIYICSSSSRNIIKLNSRNVFIVHSPICHIICPSMYLSIHLSTPIYLPRPSNDSIKSTSYIYLSISVSFKLLYSYESNL